NIDFENIKDANVEKMKIDTDIENMQMNSKILHIQTSHEKFNINEKRPHEEDDSIEKGVKRIC
ncbi:11620_t:CDS:1, partial [Scutellospora calospora]